jgi:hypothetical protein
MAVWRSFRGLEDIGSLDLVSMQSHAGFSFRRFQDLPRIRYHTSPIHSLIRLIKHSKLARSDGLVLCPLHTPLLFVFFRSTAPPPPQSDVSPDSGSGDWLHSSWESLRIPCKVTPDQGDKLTSLILTLRQLFCLSPDFFGSDPRQLH